VRIGVWHGQRDFEQVRAGVLGEDGVADGSHGV
jgi:hypothetical protein